jgi:Zn-finger domain-containing protein
MIIGKKQPSSWKNSFERAFFNLTELGILSAQILFEKSKVEIHVDKNYLQKLLDNPWFFPLHHVNSPNMLTLSLKWFLSTVRNNRNMYSIGIEKLMGHLAVEDRPARFVKRIVKATKDIGWITSATRDGDLIRFKQTHRAILVYDLRSVLTEQIENGC